MAYPPKKTMARRRLLRSGHGQGWFSKLLFMAVVSIALITFMAAYQVLDTISQIFVSADRLSQQAPQAETVNAPPAELVVAANEAPTPVLSTGTNRITILLLGIDQRDEQPIEGTRSDTMMVVTVDPTTKTAGILAMPRDLLVRIPGYQPNKINVAHAIGGPALAKRTIEENFGLKVNYFARVNFNGFVRMIDSIGGVTIDIKNPIRDEQYPVGFTNDVQRVYLNAGLQQLDGTTALIYARSRHQDGDLSRMERQQEVLFAARQQALQANLIQRLPELLGLLGSTVQTDIPLAEIPALARLGSQIEPDDILARSIDEEMFEVSETSEGYYLIPDWSAIRSVVQELVRDPRLNREAATITIETGEAYFSQARELASRLRSLGYRTVTLATVEPEPGSSTRIYDDGSHPATASAIAGLLGLNDDAIQIQLSERYTSGILISIGESYPEIGTLQQPGG